MLFKNKIEYTKELFVEVYRTEMKKVLLVLRIITGLAVAAAILFMIYGAVTRGSVLPGDFFNLGISVLMALLCTFLPNLMARSQMKKCKKKGLLGERTLRFTEHVLTMTYEKEGRSTDIPLEQLAKVTEFDNYIRITIGGRSTFLDKKRFEIGEAAAFVTWAEDKIAENAEKEEEALAWKKQQNPRPWKKAKQKRRSPTKIKSYILTKNILAEWWKMAVHFCAQSFFVYFCCFFILHPL